MSDKPTLYALRIRMRHCIDDGAVSFLPTPAGSDDKPLVTFEREIARIVAEETATLRAEIARLKAAALSEAINRVDAEVRYQLERAQVTPHCDWHGHPIDQVVGTEISTLQHELADRGEEVVRLQGIIDGMAARIAAQSDALSRAAERDATARLDAWQKAEPRQDRLYEVSSFRVYITGLVEKLECEVFVCPSPAAAREIYAVEGRVQVIGTDEQPATLAECIDAALVRWQELYGEGKANEKDKANEEGGGE